MPLMKIDQTTITKQLSFYLNMINASSQIFNPFETKTLAQKLIDDVEEDEVVGYCEGLTALWLYSKYCQFHKSAVSSENTTPSPLMDYQWFLTTAIKISTLDRNSALSPQDHKDIKCFLFKIEGFRYIYCYFPMGLAQYQLSMKNQFGMSPRDEKKLVGFCNRNQLAYVFNQLIKDDKLVHITIDDHTIGFYKHENTIFFYDCNEENGELHCSTFAEAAKAVFEITCEAEEDKSFVISFISFGFDNHQPYPPLNEILDSLYKNNSAIWHDNKTCVALLHMAARLGGVENVAYYLNKNISINVKDKQKRTPLMIAAQNNQVDTVKFLLEKGANTECIFQGTTALDIAKNIGLKEVVKVITEFKHSTKENVSPHKNSAKNVNFFQPSSENQLCQTETKKQKTDQTKKVSLYEHCFGRSGLNNLKKT